MIDLHSVFRNPFESRAFGIGRLQAFAAHHLVALAQNNPGGVFDGRIAATRTALTALDDAYTDDQMSLGGRLTSKAQKRAFRKSLPAAVGKIYLSLAAKYGQRAPVLNDFFPSGRSLFHHCRDGVMEDHLGVLVTALQAHQAELGADLAAEAEGLRTGWLAVYGGSGSDAGAKKATQLMKQQARRALQRELFLTLLLLAQLFPEQPEKLQVYMNQSLLTRKRPAAGRSPGAK